MKKHFLSLKSKDDALFNIRLKIPAFVLNPLKAMMNLVVDIIYLNQLEYEMDCADLSDDHFLKIGYCGHPSSLTHIFNLSKH